MAVCECEKRRVMGLFAGFIGTFLGSLKEARGVKCVV